jgi:hypothetical protein
MAQADQSIQNATFPAVRADINNNLAALFTNSSGTGAPTVTVAFQDWIDTSGTDPVWKKRNAANNAWITLGTIDGNTIAFEGTLPDQSGNAGEYLTTDGTVASWGAITAAGQLLRAPQVLTSGVSYTAPANCTRIYVEAVGGGGGGLATPATTSAAAGRGGGSGGYCAKYFTVTPSTSYTYAIGAGGVSSGSGGNTTFTVGGTTITASGGVVGSAGGSATNGDLNVKGSPGGAPNQLDEGGEGGSSFFGGGARASTGVGQAGESGSGGGGGQKGQTPIGPATSAAGGAGGAGLIRIWEFS